MSIWGAESETGESSGSTVAPAPQAGTQEGNLSEDEEPCCSCLIRGPSSSLSWGKGTLKEGAGARERKKTGNDVWQIETKHRRLESYAAPPQEGRKKTPEVCAKTEAASERIGIGRQGGNNLGKKRNSKLLRQIRRKGVQAM